MKNNASRFISIFIATIMLLTITSSTIYGVDKSYKISSAPPQISKELKGTEELIKYFNEIKRIRNNMNTISINAETAKQKSDTIQKQITSYSSELKTILNLLARFKVVYKDSPSDLFVANQIEIVAFILDSSLQQQSLLVERLAHGEATDLFFSEYLVSIYYYLNIADEMINYLERFYGIK
ncbi:MAG: hypothetical protein KIB53_09580 [Paraclostridium bifermentans]|uniref:hypothetical protein n=1 Tax=Paraclostridium TaxID=1849822 RepID=UPI00124339E9|nr:MULTISPECIES: hypothetical protein [Paraclostridium]MBS5954059.1 hypothetical protein [Paraclostridium bifermentans]MBZ6007332.1 hypothetical protein [Paraclostridium bifermentans]MDU0298204.1 hypothetical protein [Paraclostridium sp. MRS3W1]